MSTPTSLPSRFRIFPPIRTVSTLLESMARTMAPYKRKNLVYSWRARLPHFGILQILLDSHFDMASSVPRYVRYSTKGKNCYGILEGQAVRELKGNFLYDIAPTGNVLPLGDVRLLAPCEPSKVLAVGRNYKSHLGERTPTEYPAVFLKLPSCIIGPEEAIVIPPGATDVHYEAELVVVMGKTASKLSQEEVDSHIFGVTAGNDISERVWQKNDVQWFRAKASDTFGPLGPAIVQGLNYNDLLVTKPRKWRSPPISANLRHAV